MASGLFCSSAKASPANHRVPVDAESLPTERSIPVSFALCGLLVPASQDTACHSEDFFPSALGFCRSLSALLSILAPRGLDQRSRSFRSHFAVPCTDFLTHIGDHVQGGHLIQAKEREREEAKARLRGFTQPLLFFFLLSFFHFSLAR